MTQSSNDEETVNILATQLGFPPDISPLLHKLEVNAVNLSLSDGQTSLVVDLQSNGLTCCFQALIRFLSTAGKHDEMQYY